jgi:3-oxoacyl-[acyl-carrier protein] reductase
MNWLDFSTRTVLVVGGSSGIGNGIAQAFRAQGAQVHVWGTRASAEDYADNPDSDLSGLHYSQVDVADFDALAQHQPAFEHLDVLVLAQGTVMYQRAEYELANFQHVMAVNLASIMACCNKFEAMLSDSQGAIITISSTAAFHSTPGNPAYNASKAGAVGLTRTLGDTWARKGIRVNGIAPGLVDTKLTKVTTEHPKRLQAFLDHVPMGRLGTPQDMAGVALFLASPMAAYIVGQTIPVDGGLILR